MCEQCVANVNINTWASLVVQFSDCSSSWFQSTREVLSTFHWALRSDKKCTNTETYTVVQLLGRAGTVLDTGQSAISVPTVAPASLVPHTWFFGSELVPCPLWDHTWFRCSSFWMLKNIRKTLTSVLSLYFLLYVAQSDDKHLKMSERFP
jgi:hypothetical protein